ncbi:Lcl domain-containing protein [Psychromonas sp. Urea-02u-13]|uniref:Lcl domain-containing protein n=1 Tax=Psychromonas sp. Urea-02u-13 TaxID=2058326 RepID=UPI000C34AD73|nr:DUF1566 domain-containing protein [Psychromonas sp. Urea-02u-13]PKG37893.1 hypothetical protein CXF74_16560 [Psychromonas sp. Urea-02u-13]
MKYQLTIVTLALLAAGCNSSDSGGSSDQSSPTYSVSGRVTALAASGSETVCADLNGNFTCDSGEPSVPANNGLFTITSSQKSILNAPLIVQLDASASNLSRYSKASKSGEKTNAFFVSPGQQKATGNEINAITTLVAGQVASGKSIDEAVQLVKKQLLALGLPATDNLLNEGSNNEYATLENNILSIIGAMDKSAADYSLAILSGSLEDYKDILLNTAPTEEALKGLVDELNQSADAVALNDTGVTTFLSDGGVSSISQVDYPGQDADFGSDAKDKGFKFVKLDANGQPLATEVAEWPCVKDERTGLIWESKLNDASSAQHFDRLFAYQVSGKFEPYIEDIKLAGCEATGDNICTTEQYVNYLNEMKVCGISTWRLPTFNEFYGLINFGETQKDDDDEVYGLTHAYFPLQSKASYLETGSVWTSTPSFTEYSDTAMSGSEMRSLVQTRGSNRGTVSMIEIYSDQVENDNYDSYQMPLRLVAKGITQ